MNRQEQWRQRYKELHPEWNSSPIPYKDLIGQHVGADTRILDIGCGHTDFLKEIYDRTPHSYGIDPDAETLKKNVTIKHTSVADAESLLFENNFFDVVVLAWVLEHLEDPGKVFSEVHRVLKPGGVVIFLTPNAWNYNVWIIRAIPNAFHDFFTRRLYNRQEHDTFPTRYRINSMNRVEKLLTKIGFEKKQIILNGDPTYIGLNAPLFWFACLIERMLDIPRLQKMRVHLIGCYRKTP
ncbi:MAG: class I SAM-dependent methyltransferase [Candidatus Peribacteraceae bacterium]|nr:class I SAM-dependent methyltransferase [Candidatus Peribacteraceae bacterium]